VEPQNPRAYPPAVQAILAADLIVVGPGSLYTSLVPNLLVPDIRDALRLSRAQKFFVCNVATQPGETDGFSCDDHLNAVEKLCGEGTFDLVIANDRWEGKLPDEVSWVTPTAELADMKRIHLAPLASEALNSWHDPQLLSRAIMDLYAQRTSHQIDH